LSKLNESRPARPIMGTRLAGLAERTNGPPIAFDPWTSKRSNMKSDAQLKTDVTDELQWDPSVNATHVGVTVKDGVVTLTGHLETYVEKFAAERAVERVEGVKAIAIELDVKLAPGHQRSDSEIAEAVESAIRWHAMIPAGRVHIKVEKGWVTLGGEVDWDHQRKNAENIVRPIKGVVGVRNDIGLKLTVVPSDVSKRIRDALSRHADREAKNIEVSVTGSSITLTGRVDSWADRIAAQSAAWSAPGVSAVTNRIVIGMPA
jgi:osmotically-inducible protein OsmY